MLNMSTQSKRPGKLRVVSEKCSNESYYYQCSFLDSIDRLSEDDYEPTDTDILQARVKTIGITEHKFEIDSVVYRYGHYSN